MQLAMQMPHMPLRPASADWTDRLARDLEAEFRLAEGAEPEQPAIAIDTGPTWLGFAVGMLVAVALGVVIGILPATFWAPASCEAL